MQETKVLSLGGEDTLEENGNPLQYSCLENSMDRGAWCTAVHWGHKELDTTEQRRKQTQLWPHKMKFYLLEFYLVHRTFFS